MTIVELSPLMGSTTPRLWTPPLRELTPATSKGFEVVEFATGLGFELMPWQEWLLVHALELREDGTGYRFRTVLTEVARQSGKTTLLAVLALWRLAADGAELVLGTSVSLETAREAWNKAVELAEFHGLATKVTRGALDTSLHMGAGRRYKIAAANSRGGRGLSVDLAIVDELREHTDHQAWSAITGATTARVDPQVWAISNAGELSSVVLNGLRDQAIAQLDGDGSSDVGYFGWTADPKCEIDDREAWSQANPALGHTIREVTLAGKMRSMPPMNFRTEHLCIPVATTNPAIDHQAWEDCADPGGTMDALRDRIFCGVDVSLDGSHVTLVAAARLDDGRVRLETVAAWDSTSKAKKELPALLDKVRPKVVGWVPGGPAASLAASLRSLRRSEEVKAVQEVCMSFAELVSAREIIHSADPMLTGQVTGASKLNSGDGWRFTRRGSGNCDAVYAAALAVHLARGKVRVGRPRILLSS